MACLFCNPRLITRLHLPATHRHSLHTQPRNWGKSAQPAWIVPHILFTPSSLPRITSRIMIPSPTGTKLSSPPLHHGSTPVSWTGPLFKVTRASASQLHHQAPIFTCEDAPESLVRFNHQSPHTLANSIQPQSWSMASHSATSPRNGTNADTPLQISAPGSAQTC